MSDAEDVEAGFKDGNTAGVDYTYDENGNMISDANKEITSISYNNLNLPEEVSFENGNKIVYIYDASGTKLRQEVYENETLQKATDYIGSLIIENDTLQFIQTAEGRVVPKTVDGVDKNEYQYHLKDHLGNVRSTFAVRDDEWFTDFEYILLNDSSEHPYFENYDQITILSNPLKRSGNYTHRLGGGGNEVIGLMKTLYVSKGDKLNAEVYGKYLDAQFTDDGINGGALINALVTMLGGSVLSGEGTTVQNNLNSDYISAAMADGSQEESPKAYLNYIMLDKNFNYVNSGFERLSASAADPGDGSGTHQKLSFEEILIEEDGYLMVFLSNESEQTVEVFWDDFRVDHHYNAVLQADDYYPFGLTFNSYKREFSKKNKMNTFQDQEYDEETGWVQFKWRNHMPELGRFFNVDPLAEDYVYNSPYAFSENQVTAHVELEGMEKAYRDPATGTIIPASDNIRHDTPAGVIFNNGGPTKSQVGQLIESFSKPVGRGSSVVETATDKKVSKQTGLVKGVNKLAKKTNSIITILSISNDFMSTDFHNSEETGEFIEKTVQNTMEAIPVIGPALGTIADDSKKEDGVTNIDNMSKNYSTNLNAAQKRAKARAQRMSSSSQNQSSNDSGGSQENTCVDGDCN